MTYVHWVIERLQLLAHEDALHVTFVLNIEFGCWLWLHSVVKRKEQRGHRHARLARLLCNHALVALVLLTLVLLVLRLRGMSWL
jgi:hypothetical protein